MQLFKFTAYFQIQSLFDSLGLKKFLWNDLWFVFYWSKFQNVLRCNLLSNDQFLLSTHDQRQQFTIPILWISWMSNPACLSQNHWTHFERWKFRSHVKYISWMCWHNCKFQSECPRKVNYPLYWLTQIFMGKRGEYQIHVEKQKFNAIIHQCSIFTWKLNNDQSEHNRWKTVSNTNKGNNHFISGRNPNAVLISDIQSSSQNYDQKRTSNYFLNDFQHIENQFEKVHF